MFLICKHLNPLHQRMLSAKFGPAFWRRRFFNYVNALSLFRNYLPLEMGKVLHLNKLEFPSPKDALTKAVAQFISEFASRAEGWVFESQPRQT